MTDKVVVSPTSAARKRKRKQPVRFTFNEDHMVNDDDDGGYSDDYTISSFADSEKPDESDVEYESDDGFVVPDGYLSEGEGDYDGMSIVTVSDDDGMDSDCSDVIVLPPRTIKPPLGGKRK